MFKSKASKPVQGLFQITVKVGRGSNADMPSSLAGAIVPAYAVAEDWQDAAKRAVANLVSQGFEFLDIQGTIAQLDPAGWTDYVAKVWPECASSLPTQAEVVAGLNGGLLFFGPFVGFESAREG